MFSTITSNLLWAVTSAVGAGLCFFVLLVIAAVWSYPLTRSHLDRVSFRIVTIALVAKWVHVLVAYLYPLLILIDQYDFWDCKRCRRNDDARWFPLWLLNFCPAGEFHLTIICLSLKFDPDSWLYKSRASYCSASLLIFSGLFVIIFVGLSAFIIIWN